jgi:hypothetical protein
MKLVKIVHLAAVLLLSGCNDHFDVKNCSAEGGWYITTSDCGDPRGGDFAYFGNTSYTDGGFKAFVNECGDVTYVYISSVDIDEIVSTNVIFTRVSPADMSAFEADVDSFDRECARFLVSSRRWF